MLGNKKGKMIYGYVPDYVLFDLETTGTSCIYDEVIEISAVKVRSGKVVEEFSQLVNPKRPIPYAASMVNHISDEMVANEPDFGQVLPEFLTFAGDDILVGHNIQTFDMKFLSKENKLEYVYQTSWGVSTRLLRCGLQSSVSRSGGTGDSAILQSIMEFQQEVHTGR